MIGMFIQFKYPFSLHHAYLFNYIERKKQYNEVVFKKTEISIRLCICKKMKIFEILARQSVNYFGKNRIVITVPNEVAAR